MRGSVRFLLGVCAAAIGLAAPAKTPLRAGAQRPVIQIETISTRADLVTDGDARLVVSAGGDGLTGLKVTANGRDVTTLFDVAGGAAEGVVAGLRPGNNVIRAVLPDGRKASLTLVNHSMQGPLVSGPQLQPWICAAAPEPTDKDAPAAYNTQKWNSCALQTSYSYFYRSTASDCVNSLARDNSCFRPYDPTRGRPADMAVAKTDDGRSLDYIVRVEHGSVDRGMYDIATLFDPAQGDGRPIWNHKIVYTFGGASGNVRRQVPPVSSWANDDALSLGFMSVVSSVTDAALNSNRVLSAETLMMLREHASDKYGRVRYLIGQGCSAGTIQQMVIGSMYPGLIDGTILSCSFPDSETAATESVDSMMVGTYFKSAAFAHLNANLAKPEVDRKEAAMAGHRDTGTVQSWLRYFVLRTPGLTGSGPLANGCKLPNAWIYDANRNPDGLRCTIADLSVNIWGRDPGSRAARLVYDNVGVQYGLHALLDGKIDGEDFVGLNEGVGGVDPDFNYISTRTRASIAGLRIAYADGIVSDPHQLAKMVILDLRGDDNSGVHTTRASFTLRDRLRLGNGNLDNYVMWRAALPINPPFPWKQTGLIRASLLAVDDWLDRVNRDTRQGTIEQRIKRDRPDYVRSFCYIGTDYRTRVYDESKCDADPDLKPYSSIRIVAGGPLSNDILKCSLKPLDRRDYGNRLSDAQFQRLAKVFADGVCDWRKPGIGEQGSTPWRTFAAGPGGVPLGPRPTSKSI